MKNSKTSFLTALGESNFSFKTLFNSNFNKNRKRFLVFEQRILENKEKELINNQTKAL